MTLRPVLSSLPAYVPGRSVPGAIKLASNEVPYPPLPSVLERIASAAAGINRYPDNGSAELTAALAARCGVGVENVARRVRLGVAVHPARAGRRRRRRRGDLRLALVRGVPDHRRGQRRLVDPGTAHRGPRPRPGRDARPDHRQDAAGLRLQPEQPDRHRGAPRRAGALPARGAARRRGRARRGLPRVRPRPRRARRAARCSTSSRTSSCCARSPRPTAWPACASATRSRRDPALVARPGADPGALRRHDRRPAGRARQPRTAGRGRAARPRRRIVAERTRVYDALLELGYEVPPSAGELRLAAARRCAPPSGRPPARSAASSSGPSPAPAPA